MALAERYYGSVSKLVAGNEVGGWFRAVVSPYGPQPGVQSVERVNVGIFETQQEAQSAVERTQPGVRTSWKLNPTISGIEIFDAYAVVFV